MRRTLSPERINVFIRKIRNSNYEYARQSWLPENQNAIQLIPHFPRIKRYVHRPCRCPWGLGVSRMSRNRPKSNQIMINKWNIYGLRIGYDDINNNDIVNTKYTDAVHEDEESATLQNVEDDSDGGGSALQSMPTILDTLWTDIFRTENKYLMPLQPSPTLTHTHTHQIVYVSVRFLHRIQQTGRNTCKIWRKKCAAPTIQREKKRNIVGIVVLGCTRALAWLSPLAWPRRLLRFATNVHSFSLLGMNHFDFSVRRDVMVRKHESQPMPRRYFYSHQFVSNIVTCDAITFPHLLERAWCASK